MAGDIMAGQAQAQDQAGGQATGARRRPPRTMILSQRDIDGLLLCGEHYGAPADLLASALRVQPEMLRRIIARWKRTGFVATARLGPGPRWCWLTREGMSATGLGFVADRPALGRLAHIRAVLATRLWLASGPAWSDGQAWWHSERRLRAGHQVPRTGHVPDAEVHWPGIAGSPYADQVWALEVELTPKPVGRTTEIMTGLLASPKYATVVYLTAPAARPIVLRAVTALPPIDQPRVAVRDLPPAALMPEPRP